MTKNQNLVQTSGDKTAPVVTTRYCQCGCGEATSSSKTSYKPGHDARHVGIVARDIASSAQPFFERVTADSDLGSEKLVAKAHAMAERLLAKQAAKTARTATTEDHKAPKPTKAERREAALLVAEEENRFAAEQAAKRAEAEAAIQEEEAEKVPSWTEGTVKVGRWEYPSRTSGEVVQRNTKRDGSGEWVFV